MNDRQKAILAKLKNRPVEFGWKCGFVLLSELHNEWIKAMIFGAEDETLQSHRGSYKTTCVSIALALIIILYPNDHTAFVRKTDENAKEILAQVKKMLNTNFVKELVLELYSVPLIITKDSATGLSTNLCRDPRGAPQLVCSGLGSSLTGQHYERIFTDDIVNINDRVSRADREKTKLMYQELQNLKNRPPLRGKIYNTGTPWHKEDAFTLMPNIKKYDCYSTGLMTKAEIMDKRDSMSPSLFAANYELKHIADENAMFTEPQFTSNIESIYDGIAQIDAAYGGEDSTALTILKESAGLLFVYGRKYDKHVEDCIDDILMKKAKYRAGTTWCEANADKGYLAASLIKKGDLAASYHEKMNKHIKISTYLKENWKRVRFIDDTDPEYISQILDYTENAAHDDCPDSLASAIRQLTKGRPKLQTFHGGI